jgi:VanZ family protein
LPRSSFTSGVTTIETLWSRLSDGVSPATLDNINARPQLMSHRLQKWIPALAWAALIFIFSGEAFSEGNTRGLYESMLRDLFPAVSGTAIDLIHLSIRKLGHFGEYLVLAVLVLRALRDDREEKLNWNRFGLALMLVALYAVSDEGHQAFVPGRNASIADVLVDVFGGISGILWFRLRNRRNNLP